MCSSHKAMWFTAVDFIQAYHMVKIPEGSRDPTSYTSPIGVHRWVAMPFGLASAVSTFAKLMMKAMKNLDWVNCYLDDALIVSETIEQHCEHLEIFFDRVRRANLRLNAKKCKICRKEVACLGHLISSEGLKADPSKTSAVADAPTPKSVKELRSFLGLSSYPGNIHQILLTEGNAYESTPQEGGRRRPSLDRRARTRDSRHQAAGTH